MQDKRPSVTTDESCKDGNIVQLQCALIADDLYAVLTRAHKLGFVITVDIENLQPFAMGNYRMDAKIRSRR